MSDSEELEEKSEWESSFQYFVAKACKRWGKFVFFVLTIYSSFCFLEENPQSDGIKLAPEVVYVLSQMVEGIACENFSFFVLFSLFFSKMGPRH